MKAYKYLIVGGGMTADAAVKGIREIDANGSIGVLTAESDPPYARPPLSKSLWLKKNKTVDDIWCKTEERGAEVLTSTRAVALEAQKRQIVDNNGVVYQYDRLLLATGGKLNRLPFSDNKVIYYRTLQDYRSLRDWAKPGQHLVVIGGGFIGTEMAAALASNGVRTSMVFPEANICGRLLPAAFASTLNQYYTDHGVTIVPQRKLSAIDAHGGIIIVHLENGQTLSVDGIVAGIGIVPNTQLAENAGLDVDNGILVDEHLLTSHPDVFSAGDVANFYNPLLGKRMRVEHEDNALTMGLMAGRNMAGENESYHHLPFFYSDLFDVGYEAVGETDPSLTVVTDLAVPKDKGCIFYTKYGRVRGVIFWNVFGHLDAGRKLIAEPGPHDAKSLRTWEKERVFPN